MSELTRKQEKVLLTLLNGLTITDASKANSISETTIYNWLQNDTFKTAYRKLRREAVESSLTRIQQATHEAVETLRRNLTCENPAVEVRTVQIILEMAFKGVDMIDFEERLAKLEQDLELAEVKDNKNEIGYAH